MTEPASTEIVKTAKPKKGRPKKLVKKLEIDVTAKAEKKQEKEKDERPEYDLGLDLNYPANVREYFGTRDGKTTLHFIGKHLAKKEYRKEDNFIFFHIYRTVSEKYVATIARSIDHTDSTSCHFENDAFYAKSVDGLIKKVFACTDLTTLERKEFLDVLEEAGLYTMKWI